MRKYLLGSEAKDQKCCKTQANYTVRQTEQNHAMVSVEVGLSCNSVSRSGYHLALL